MNKYIVSAFIFGCFLVQSAYCVDYAVQQNSFKQGVNSENSINDYSDYYNKEKSVRWQEPQNLKVYLNASAVDIPIIKKAYSIWQSRLNGKIKFTFVSDEAEANIVFKIVDNPDVQIQGKTDYGVFKVFGDKKYLQKVYVNITVNANANQSDMLLTSALHEIGHSLGIRYHSENKNDIMYYNANSTKSDNISQRDINTVKKIYE